MLLRSALRRVDRDVDCNAAWTASSFIAVTGEARVTSRFISRLALPVYPRHISRESVKMSDFRSD